MFQDWGLCQTYRSLWHRINRSFRRDAIFSRNRKRRRATHRDPVHYRDVRLFVCWHEIVVVVHVDINFLAKVDRLRRHFFDIASSWEGFGPGSLDNDVRSIRLKIAENVEQSSEIESLKIKIDKNYFASKNPEFSNEFLELVQDESFINVNRQIFYRIEDKLTWTYRRWWRSVPSAYQSWRHQPTCDRRLLWTVTWEEVSWKALQSSTASEIGIVEISFGMKNQMIVQTAESSTRNDAYLTLKIKIFQSSWKVIKIVNKLAEHPELSQSPSLCTLVGQSQFSFPSHKTTSFPAI